ncbi:MAG TPA: magnesium/cobalt transporter CorA [Syntrophales bacterium]|nr:magnesium/cobalt transporter CorA [Syntrophales bacterium]
MIKRSRKSGLPPGSLVHIGLERGEKTRITVLDYDEAHVEEREVQSIDELAVYCGKPSVTWIDVVGIHEPTVIEQIGRQFGVHPLLMEDIMNTTQRPKIDDLGKYICLILKLITFEEKEMELRIEQLSVVFSDDFVISFQESESGIFKPLRDRIRGSLGRVRSRGTDYLAYTLLDTVVDHYFAVMENMGEKIDSLENEVVANPRRETLRSVQQLRDEILLVRRSVWPLREVISLLERAESPLIDKTSAIYFRDIYEHTIQVMDTVDTYRDILSGMFDIYLSSISNRLNEVMKVLTIIATLFMPLTFLAGVYGMNFEHMPELKWQYGYFILWGVMGVIALAMLAAFRRRKWI